MILKVNIFGLKALQRRRLFFILNNLEENIFFQSSHGRINMIQLARHMPDFRRQEQYRKQRWISPVVLLGFSALATYFLVIKEGNREPYIAVIVPPKEEVAIIETPEQLTIEPDPAIEKQEEIIVPVDLMPSTPEEPSVPINEINDIESKENTGEEDSGTINEDDINTLVLLDAPFRSQAPLGDWADPAQQDGCEEASVLMAIRWAQGQGLGAEEMIREVRAAADYQAEQIEGFHGDTSVQDTLDIIINGYFQWDRAEIKEIDGAEDIYEQLEDGKLVVVPVNGRILANPHYTAPGPDHHTLLIIGYDYGTEEFITNDPGTRYGASYRYTKDVMLSAITDYPTTSARPAPAGQQMIVISR